MSYLDQLFNVTVLSTGKTPTVQGFGTPMIAGYHTRWTDRVRVYTSLAGLEGDGFLPTDPIHQIAAGLLAQNPAVSQFKVGRRASAFTQVAQLTPTDPAGVAGVVYGLRVMACGRTTGVGPFPLALAPGATLQVVIGTHAPVTATFNGTPGVLADAGTGTYTSVTATHALHLHIGGTPQVIPFATGIITAAGYRDALTTWFIANGALASAAVVAGKVVITTTQQGTGATITVDSSGSDMDVLTSLGLSASQAGTGHTGNVANLAAVTSGEFASVVNGALGTAGLGTAAVAGTDGDGNPYIQTATPGGSIQIALASTARTALGFDAAAHTGAMTVAKYTSAFADNSALVCTGLAAAINALPTVVAADGTSGTHVTVTAQFAGVLVAYSTLVPGTLDPTPTLSWLDATVDPGLAADLAAINTGDIPGSGGWYGLLLDSQGSAEILAAAAWVQTACPHPALFVAQTGDTGCTVGSTSTDVLSALKALGYTRTATYYQPFLGCNWLAAASMGDALPTPPGASIWGFQQLAGVLASQLSDSAVVTVLGNPGDPTGVYGKAGNLYVTVAGVDVTQRGMVAAVEWIDVVVFLDWLRVNLQADEFALILSYAARGGKIPYTDVGAAQLATVIRTRLKAGIAVGGLASDPPFVITVPKVATVSSAAKTARVLPGITFSAPLAGAIQASVVTGSVQ